jgi:hypothetical protein
MRGIVWGSRRWPGWYEGRRRTETEEISVMCGIVKGQGLFEYSDAWREGNKGIFKKRHFLANVYGLNRWAYYKAERELG